MVQTSIFETFWNNEALRGTLFTKLEETEKSEAKEEFQDLVNDFNSLIYQFIKVK
jgi:hypothetical protein